MSLHKIANFRARTVFFQLCNPNTNHSTRDTLCVQETERKTTKWTNGWTEFSLRTSLRWSMIHVRFNSNIKNVFQNLYDSKLIIPFYHTVFHTVRAFGWHDSPLCTTVLSTAPNLTIYPCWCPVIVTLTPPHISKSPLSPMKRDNTISWLKVITLKSWCLIKCQFSLKIVIPLVFDRFL